jgi:hypothetical protein
MIDWNGSKKEYQLVDQIVERSEPIFKKLKIDIDIPKLRMDIIACHLNHHKLDLDAMVTSNSISDVYHDVRGIACHIDRETGKLKDCFVPRFTLPQPFKIGAGATIQRGSDSVACTVIDVSKSRLILQRDRATLKDQPGNNPEFVSGGFAGHCTNQSELKYDYARDLGGEKFECTWRPSEKRFRLKGQHKGFGSVSHGRYEFYDYNF